MAHRLFGPRRRFLRVAGRTWIGNLELIRHRGRDEAERMRMHVGAGDAFGFDLRHMTSRALASRTAHSMMCVLFYRCRVGAVWRCGTVAFHAELVSRRPQLRPVLRAVYIVTGRTHDAVLVHNTLGKVVALHAILVRCAIGEIIESGLPRRAVLKLPEIPQPQADTVTHRPIVVPTFNWTGNRPPLRMATDARVISRD